MTTSMRPSLPLPAHTAAGTPVGVAAITFLVLAGHVRSHRAAREAAAPQAIPTEETTPQVFTTFNLPNFEAAPSTATAAGTTEPATALPLPVEAITTGDITREPYTGPSTEPVYAS